MDTTSQQSYQQKAVELLKADAEKIAKLIKVQIDHLTLPQCPLYEEVLDTQMYGLSKEIDFAVKLGLMERVEGRVILSTLEKELSVMHDAYTNKK
ncbi:MAG TPA: YlaN family protein [Paenisporosarcina sp.]|nr:YlaN family protein [Paenisporosarcina sp.]